MRRTIRIDECTHAILCDWAMTDKLSVREEVARAVEFYRRERFFRNFDEAFARLTPHQRSQYSEETLLWEPTLADGLDEP